MEREQRICTSPQIITKRWLPKKKHKKAHREGLFLAIVVFSLTLCSHFSFYCTHFYFNPIVHLFSHFFCLFVQKRKQAKKWLKNWTIELKMWTVKEKRAQSVTEKTTIARNRSAPLSFRQPLFCDKMSLDTFRACCFISFQVFCISCWF